MTRRAALLVLLAAVSCSSPGRPTSALLLPSPGPGYHLSSASGPLTKQALAVATAVPHDTMAAYLDSVSFRSASERVWTSREDGFVTDAMIEVADAGSAAKLVDVAGSSLPGEATTTFALGVAGGRGFLQTSDVRGQTMFCVIAFFSVDVKGFVITRCTPYPQDTATVARLSKQQVARVNG